MKRGDIVTIPKEPTYGECVVFDVKYSEHGEALLNLVTKRDWKRFWTRAKNCEKVLDNFSEYDIIGR